MPLFSTNLFLKASVCPAHDEFSRKHNRKEYQYVERGGTALCPVQGHKEPNEGQDSGEIDCPKEPSELRMGFGIRSPSCFPPGFIACSHQYDIELGAEIHPHPNDDDEHCKKYGDLHRFVSWDVCEYFHRSSRIASMVGNTRFELVTSTMSMWRSNQLS
jgi:hypothetical protein